MLPSAPNFRIDGKRALVTGAQGPLAACLPGSVINVSSQMGWVGSPRRTMYCLSKHAIEDIAFREWVTGRIALGRPGKIEETMGAIMFLASEASDLMTGSALMLDGGWTAA